MNRKRYFVEAQRGTEKDCMDFIELKEAKNLVEQLLGTSATKITLKESEIDELDNVVSDIVKLDIEDGTINKNDIEFTIPEKESGLNFLRELGAIEFDLDRIDLVNKFRESELDSAKLGELETLIKRYWEVKNQPDALPIVTEIARVLGIVEEQPEEKNDEYFLVYEFDDGSEYPVNKKVGLGEAVRLAKEGFISNDFKKITIKGVKESYELTADTIITVDKLLEGLAANAFNDEVFDKAMKENEENRAKEEELNTPTDIDKPKKVGKLDQKGAKEVEGELHTYGKDGKIVKEELNKGEYQQYEIFDGLANTLAILNIKRSPEEVIEYAKGLRDAFQVSRITRDGEDEYDVIVDEEVIWEKEDIEESKKPKLESSLKEKDLTFRQLRNIMKKSKAYGDGTEDRITDLLTANKANLDDKAPKRIVDRVLQIIGKNEAYKIHYGKTDSHGKTSEPYKDKEFETRYDAKDYLKRHPGAKGAKIVKEAYPRSYKKVVVKNLEEYKNFVNNWNGESTEVEIWLTPTRITSVGFTTIKGQRPQYQVPTGITSRVSYPDIEGAKRVALANSNNLGFEESIKESFKNYKGYQIEKDFYNNISFTVQYQGDDLVFDSEEEAKKFIDEITNISENKTKGKGMITIKEELEDDERAQALANYLEVDVDTLTNNGGKAFETEDSEEYLVLTEEEAREEAEQSIESLFDDLGIESFTPSFQDWIFENAVDNDWFEDAMRESYDNYIGDIRDEEDNVFENRLISEMVDEGILTEDDFDNWGEDSPTVKEDIEMWSKEEEYLDKLCDQDAVEWYKDNFGLTDFKDVIKENPNIIDMEEVVDEAISQDGISHFIATYDGSGIELENGYYAYRTN